MLTLFDDDTVLFCERALRYAYLKRAWVLYMKPGTVSVLRIANFNSLFY